MISLANGFAEEGYAVDLLVLKPVGQYAGHVNAKVRIISLDRRRLALSLFPLMRYMKESSPQTILALDEYTHLLALTARFFTKSKIRIVLRVGNMLSELFVRYEGLKNKVLPYLVRRLYRYADAIIAVSKGVRDDVIAVTKIDQERVSVVYQPKSSIEIRAKAKSQIDHPWFQSTDVPVLLFVGRLRVQKNIASLIRAFARVVDRLPARLMILGSGREETRLAELIRHHNLTNSVELVGYVDNPYAYMHQASIFVFPTLWEGMPNALLEAMVVGLPVISTDSSGSGPREVLAPDSDHRVRITDGIEFAEYGVLTAVGDEVALTEAMYTLLTNLHMRKHYAQKSLERARAFEAKDVMKEYAKILLPST